MDTKVIDHNETIYGLGPKTKSAILFVLNLLVIAPFILRGFQFGYVVAAIVILAITFYMTVPKLDENLDLSVCRMLPHLLFLDILIVLLKIYEPLTQHFGRTIPNINWDVAALPFSALLIFGAILCMLSFSKLESRLWLFTLGALIIGFAFTVVVWHTLNFQNFHFKRKGEIYFLLYCSFALIWFFFCGISGFCNPRKAGKVALMNIGIVAFTYILNFQEFSLLKNMSKELNVMYFQLPDTAFAWWKIILIFLVLGGCAVVMESNQKDFIGTDCYVMFSLAAMTIIMKVYLENYFFLNWCVLILIMIAFLVGLKCQADRKSVFGYTDLKYIIGLFLISLACLIWLKNNYWMNVILVGIFILIVHRTHNPDFVSKNRPWLWIMLLVFVAANAMGYYLVECYILESFFIIAAFLLIACIVMYILNHPHPSGHTAPFFLKLAVLVLLSIGCFLPTLGAGADVETEVDPVEKRVKVLLEANGRKNEVSSAYCYWTGDDGEKIGKNIRIKGGDANIRIRAKKLTIVVEDKEGRITTKSQWFLKRYVGKS